MASSGAPKGRQRARSREAKNVARRLLWRRSSLAFPFPFPFAFSFSFLSASSFALLSLSLRLSLSLSRWSVLLLCRARRQLERCGPPDELAIMQSIIVAAFKAPAAPCGACALGRVRAEALERPARSIFEQFLALARRARLAGS